MAEKNLSELEWKKFAKGRGMKELPLGKAFAALDAAKAPEAELAALDEIEKQAEVLRKAHKADKEITAYLDDAVKAAAKQRKLSDAAAKKAAKEAEEEAGEDEGEDAGSDLLTRKMIPLLRQVKNGELMHVMIATVGKDTVVLLSRKPIGPPRRKLLTERLGVTAGVKFIAGECIWEENAHTFVVQTQAAGLAKKLKQALLDQTDQRCKVRVRGEDGALDDDGEDAGASPEAGGESAERESEAEGAATPGGPTQAQFDQALARLRERIDAALRAQHPQASKLRAVEAFAQGKAEAGDFAAGIKALITLKQLLDAPAGAPEPGGDPAAREQALAQWRSQRDATVKALKALATEIVADADPEARAAVIEITAVVKQLTAEPATRQQVSELMNWLQNDDVVSDVDELAEAVREPLMQRLRALQASLAD